MRWMLLRSPSAPAERDRNTPSMKTPTEGSTPKLLSPLPKPRMMKVDARRRLQLTHPQRGGHGLQGRARRGFAPVRSLRRWSLRQRSGFPATSVRAFEAVTMIWLLALGRREFGLLVLRERDARAWKRPNGGSTCKQGESVRAGSAGVGRTHGSSSPQIPRLYPPRHRFSGSHHPMRSLPRRRAD